MKTTLIATLILAASLTTSLSAQADSFTPNHLWVGGTNGKLLEFDEAKQYVRTLSLPSNAKFRGLAFGPDGNLYASDYEGGRLFMIQPSGEYEVLLDSLTNPGQIMFEEDGSLTIPTLGGTLYHFYGKGRPYAMSVLRGVSNLRGLAKGPQGYDYLGADSGVHVLDASGRSVGILYGSSELTATGPIAFAPNGNLLVCDVSGSGKVVELGYYGQYLRSFEDASLVGAANGVAVGPDGQIYVSAFAADSVTRFNLDGQKVGSLRHPDLDEPGQLAFAPFRFEAKLKGQLTGRGQALAKAKDSKVTLTVAPGMRIVMLKLTDAPALDDLASLLGSHTIVLHGFLGSESDAARKRIFSGLAVESHPLANGGTSLTLSLNGKVDSNGNYVLKQVKGSVSLQDSTRCYMGTVKGGKLIQ